ncbi:MAG: hypothetical protein AAGA25_04265 [Planctomycetota bacterium]
MSDVQTKKSAMPGWTWLILVLVVLAHGAWWWLAGAVTSGVDEAGALGDRFGFLTSLLSGLAFWGLIVTMVMQRQELAMQREELTLQREEMSESRAELAKAAEAQAELAAATREATQVARDASVLDAHVQNLITHTYNKDIFQGTNAEERISLVESKSAVVLLVRKLSLENSQHDGVKQ